MLILRPGVRLLSLSVMAMLAGFVAGQDYPGKPIRMMTGPAGGGGDFQARMVSQAITGPLGQPIVIDNRANNVLGEAIAKAPPDGYTVLLTGSSIWTLPLMQSVNYDPVRDFAPITLIERSPSLLVVHPSVPVKSVRELISLAKARPGQLNFMTAASETRFSGELFKSMTGTDFIIVSYSNNPMGYADLIGGQLQFTTGSSLITPPHIKAGRLRALAVTTLRPSELFPDLPTVSMTVPGYERASMGAVFAPARTPEAVINRLNQEISRFMRTAETKQKFAVAGSEAVSTTPEETAATIKAEMARLGKLVKDAGIRAN